MSDDTAPAAKPVSKRVRYEVLKRDGYTCKYCGTTADDGAKLTVDHVIPRTLGGSNDPSNLVAACRDCNYGKASTSPDDRTVADVDAKALEWAAALQRVADQRRADQAALDETVDAFVAGWAAWTYGEGKCPIPKGQGWRTSIERFVSVGLDADDLHRLTRVAMESKVSSSETWRYFCGCCWTEVNRRQEMATQALAATEEMVPPSEQSPDATPTPAQQQWYSTGFDDGWRAAGTVHNDRGEREYQRGYELGFRDGAMEGKEAAEVAYMDGFRRGADRQAAMANVE